MVASFPESLRWRVIFLKIGGLSASEIAVHLCVGITFVKKIIRIYRTTTGVKYQVERRGRPRIIGGRDNLVIKRLIEQYPEMYLDELKQWIFHISGQHYSISTLSRFLKNSGYTLKKNHVVPKQRNEYLRAQFRRFVGNLHKDQFLFLDESSKDDRTIQRKYGYSLKGCRLATKGNFTRGKRYSVLAGISATGVKVTHAISGAYDRVQFEFVFSQIIAPHIGSFASHEQCSVVILDNCNIHYSQTVYEIVRERGGIIIFLPPYSPDLNPVEICFGTAKRWMQANKYVCEKYPKRCLEIALHEITPEQCSSIVSSCGYC